MIMIIGIMKNMIMTWILIYHNATCRPWQLCPMQQMLMITMMITAMIAMITTIVVMMNKNTLQLWRDRPQEQLLEADS